MTSVRVFVVAIAVAIVFAVAAPVATASAPSKTKVQKFCSAVSKISSANPDDSTSEAAKNLAKTTRKAAKLAPTSKLKGALDNIAKYYDALGDADSPIDQASAAARLAASYTKAFGVYTAYYVKNCVGTS
jgi:hypothetical protein